MPPEMRGSAPSCRTGDVSRSCDVGPQGAGALIAATNRDLDKGARHLRVPRGPLYRFNSSRWSCRRCGSERGHPGPWPITSSGKLGRGEGETRRSTASPGCPGPLLSYAWPGNLRELENIHRAGGGAGLRTSRWRSLTCPLYLRDASPISPTRRRGFVQAKAGAWSRCSRRRGRGLASCPRRAGHLGGGSQKGRPHPAKLPPLLSNTSINTRSFKRGVVIDFRM